MRNTSYKDKTFEQRFNDEMWNHSERHFERLWPHPWKRFGLDQSSEVLETWKLSPFIRHAPDYLTQIKEPFLIEVQGTGKVDPSHKFKLQKLDQLAKWNREQLTVFWLWDDVAQQGTVISYAKVSELIGRGLASKGSFDGKRPYWALPVDLVVAQSDWGTIKKLVS